jgi:hypothetical protein
LQILNERSAVGIRDMIVFDFNSENTPPNLIVDWGCNASKSRFRPIITMVTGSDIDDAVGQSGRLCGSRENVSL